LRQDLFVATIKSVIVWDKNKREINLRKHGLDFKDAHLVFDDPRKVTFLSPRNDEDRRLDVAIVEVAGRVLSLAYVHRARTLA
jgi:hypothetical protein